VANEGNADATGVIAHLCTESPHVQIDQPTAGIDTLFMRETGQLSPAFQITVGPDCPTPTRITFDVSLEADWQYAATFGLDLPVGGFIDHLENGDANWTHEPVQGGYGDAWHLSDARNHTPGGLFKSLILGEQIHGPIESPHGQLPGVVDKRRVRPTLPPRVPQVLELLQGRAQVKLNDGPHLTGPVEHPVARLDQRPERSVPPVKQDFVEHFLSPVPPLQRVGRPGRHALRVRLGERVHHKARRLLL